MQKLGRCGKVYNAAKIEMDECQIKDYLKSLGLFTDNVGDIKLLKGGRNNKVYGVFSDKSYAVKVYFVNKDDPRDRFGTETEFIKFLSSCSIIEIPEIVSIYNDSKIAVYRYYEGVKVTSEDASENDYEQLISFIESINRCRNNNSLKIKNASESAFSINAHMNIFRKRLDSFKNIVLNSASDKNALDIINLLNEKADKYFACLLNVCREYKININMELEQKNRILSPSDFGFHNAIKNEDGKLIFIDFEYAGWDDPVKLFCDIFAQPDMDTDFKYFEMFMEKFLSLIDNKEEFKIKVNSMLPLFVIKWCCIILNDFNPIHCARRVFADDASIESRKLTQLKKAEDYIKKFEKLNIL